MDPKYLLGITEIDTQHQELHTLIQSLQDVIGETNKRQLIHPTLRRLHYLLVTHFAYEESFMTMSNYPDMVQHKRNHKGVLKLFEDYFRNPPAPEDYELLGKLLSDKVLGHVLEHDTHMIESMKQYLGTLSTPKLNSPHKKK